MDSTKARIIAAVVILLIVCGFVTALLLQGIALQTALVAAGGVGLVAAEIVRRLLPPPADGSGGSRTA